MTALTNPSPASFNGILLGPVSRRHFIPMLCFKTLFYRWHRISHATLNDFARYMESLEENSYRLGRVEIYISCTHNFQPSTNYIRTSLYLHTFN